MIIKSCLTIIFDGAFYNGVFEVRTKNDYYVAKVSLGTSEPTIPNILKLINDHYGQINFKQMKDPRPILNKQINPKRLQRIANKAINNGISTKAHLILKQQIEDKKKLKKKQRSLKKQQIKEARFQNKQIKRREKHRGH